MNTFGLDKNYQQFDFDEISIDDLQLIAGGSGGADLGTFIGWGSAIGGIAGTVATNTMSGFTRGGVAGAFLGTAFGVGYAIGTAAYGAYSSAAYG